MTIEQKTRAKIQRMGQEIKRGDLRRFTSESFGAFLRRLNLTIEDWKDYVLHVAEMKAPVRANGYDCKAWCQLGRPPLF